MWSGSEAHNAPDILLLHSNSGCYLCQVLYLVVAVVEKKISPPLTLPPPPPIFFILKIYRTRLTSQGNIILEKYKKFDDIWANTKKISKLLSQKSRGKVIYYYVWNDMYQEKIGRNKCLSWKIVCFFGKRCEISLVHKAAVGKWEWIWIRNGKKWRESLHNIQQIYT